MKTIYITRHAKSSWDDPSLVDFERPLNHRGAKDAPRMGKFLAGRGVKPDRIITSPARRAKTTAQHIARELDYPQGEIDVEQELYEASVHDVIDVLRSLDDAWSSVMIFGHNPTFTSLVNTLAHSNIGNVPTCGVAQIHVQGGSWKDVGNAPASLVEFFIPKEI